MRKRKCKKKKSTGNSQNLRNTLLFTKVQNGLLPENTPTLKVKEPTFANNAVRHSTNHRINLTQNVDGPVLIMKLKAPLQKLWMRMAAGQKSPVPGVEDISGMFFMARVLHKKTHDTV